MPRKRAGTDRLQPFNGYCFRCGVYGHRQIDCEAGRETPAGPSGAMAAPMAGFPRKWVRRGDKGKGKHVKESGMVKDLWRLDLSAANHMSNDSDRFQSYCGFKKPRIIKRGKR